MGWLFLLMLAGSVAEIFSIGAIMPFLAALTVPTVVFDHPLAQPFINALGLTGSHQVLAPLTILFGAAVIMAGGLRVFLIWAQTRLGFALGAEFSTEIYRRTLYQPYPVHTARNTSEVVAGVAQKADGVVSSVVLPILFIANSCVTMLMVLLALVVVQPVVTAAAVAGFGGVYVAVSVASRKRLQADGQTVSHQLSRVIKVLQEALGGIRDVIIDGTQNAYCNIYRDAVGRLHRAQSTIMVVSICPRYIVEAVGLAIIAAVAYFIATRPEGLGTAVPVIGALAFATQRMLPLMQQTYQSLAGIRGGKAMLSDVLDFLDQPMSDTHEMPSPAAILFQKNIALEGVGFHYSKESAWVFRDLGLTIEKGSRVGFIGATGSGKSTLLDLMMGLLSQSEGVFKIDGKDIRSEDIRAWQRHIAHVPQSIFLSDASVAENIAFGIPLKDIDSERVRRAAQNAQIASTIEAWPKGYDTVVGERGVRLSGGQRQRIGIARALYKQADVIIFDEATSALDGATESAVMNAINSLGGDLTLLIVAHRLTTLRNCTQVVELSAGRVNRIGSYEEIVGPIIQSESGQAGAAKGDRRPHQNQMPTTI